MSKNQFSKDNEGISLNTNFSQITQEKFIKIVECHNSGDSMSAAVNKTNNPPVSETDNFNVQNNLTNITKSEFVSNQSNSHTDLTHKVSKENINGFPSKIESANKLKTIKVLCEDNTDITENKEIPFQPNDNFIENNLIYDLNAFDKQDKRNYTATTIKNTKISNSSSTKPIKNKAHRETVLLDERFNVLEILNDKNNLLITESNENYIDSSIEETNDKFILNNYNNNQVNVNMTEYQLHKLEDSFNPLENNPTYDNFVSPNKMDFLKEKMITLNDLGRKVNHITIDYFKKNTINSQNFQSNNKKTLPPAKLNKHTRVTKSSDMSSNKSSINPHNPTGSSFNKLSQKSKNKVSSSIPSNKGITQKTPVAGNIDHKNFNTTIKKINTTSKTPPRTFTPITSSRTSKIISKDSLIKNTMISAKKPQTSTKIIQNKKYGLPQVKDQKNKTSNVAIKRNDTHISNKNKCDISINKQFTTEIIDEYDYSKIMTELKSIFGENLENFDENCKIIFNDIKTCAIYLIYTVVLFSNLDEFSNKGLIKGLIMLSHTQEKKIKLMEQSITSVRVDCNKKLNEKDLAIKKLEDEIYTFKSSLRGCNLSY